MQFRAAGKRVQVLAYRGYDKVKRRATVKLLGSFDRYGYDVPEELTNVLTDDEKKELQSHIENIRQSDNKQSRIAELEFSPGLINRMCDSIDSKECDSQTLENVTVRLLEAAQRLVRTLTTKPKQVKAIKGKEKEA